MTGSGVPASNSAEFACVIPGCRAASITMHCRPAGHPAPAAACGVADRADLALDPRMPKPPGISTMCRPSSTARRRCRPAVVGGHPPHLHLGAVLEPARTQSFSDRKVGVGEVDVLAHRLRSARSHEAHAPAAAGRSTRVQSTSRNGRLSRAPRRRRVPRGAALGDVVDRRRVRGRDDAVDVDIAHQGDLVLQRFGTSRSQRRIAASGVIPMMRSAATEC